MKVLTPPEAIQKFLAHYAARFLPPNQTTVRLLVGVSGGTDSVTLLHALHQITYPSLSIQVAHLNHRLRGESAAADADYVARLCEQLGIECHLAEYDVPSFMASHKLSLEDAARRVRYAFFAHLLSQLHLPLLLLAHNANDQAETVLLRLLRGTGPHGLAGIAPLAPLPPLDPRLAASFEVDPAFIREVQVGRPLLTVWRNEIEAYCVVQALEPRHDETNTDLHYARNRVRLDLLPYLEKNGKAGVKAGLVRLATLMHDEQKLLDHLTETEFECHALLSQSDSVEFEVGYFRSQLIALQRRLLRRAYLHLNGSLENLDAADTELLLNSGKIVVNLPGGLVGFVTEQVVGLRRFRPVVQAVSSGAIFELQPPALLGAEPGWRLEASLLWPTGDEPDFFKTGDKKVAYLDYARTGPKLLVRSRQPGEKFRPLGAPGRRKVQDLMVDAKIGREARPTWPLVIRPAEEEEPEQVVWLPGVAIAEYFKVTINTKIVLFLRFST
ncbi:MAG: tRNA lysidine(34) synthetase TilS [Chloroflexota bacterium]